jgi:hypothetical protein
MTRIDFPFPRQNPNGFSAFRINETDGTIKILVLQRINTVLDRENFRAVQ